MASPLLLRGYEGLRHLGPREVCRCRQRGRIPRIPLPAEPGAFVGVSFGQDGTWTTLLMPSVGLVFTSMAGPAEGPDAPGNRGECHRSDSSHVKLIRSKASSRNLIRIATPWSERRRAPGTLRLAGIGGKPSADTESLVRCGGARRTSSCWVDRLAGRESRPGPEAAPGLRPSPAVRHEKALEPGLAGPGGSPAGRMLATATWPRRPRCKPGTPGRAAQIAAKGAREADHGTNLVVRTNNTGLIAATKSYRHGAHDPQPGSRRQHPKRFDG